MPCQDPVVIELCRRHGEPDPKVLIIRLCEGLAGEYPTTSGPSPLRKMGSSRGIRQVHRRPITARPGYSCSGYLYVVNGGYEVTLNAHESDERQAFSEAHEIVHTFFREVRPECIPSKEEERLCDLGASILMMPAERVRRVLDTVGLSLEGLAACGREFGASIDASGCRAMAVTSEPACFFVGRMKRKKDEEERYTGEPRLRIHHWAAAGAWSDQCTYLNLPFKSDSLAADAFATEEHREGRTTLGVYFRNGIYDIEARGYSFSKPDLSAGGASVIRSVKQVCVLAREFMT
jgi:hypothetical protein